MGYAGYTAAKLPPPKPTTLQQALWNFSSLEQLETLGKLIRNVAIHPTEDKFRRVKAANPKIAPLLEALLSFGWVHDEGDKDFVVVPKGCKLTMAEVRMIEDAKDRLKKQQRITARNGRAAALAADDDKAAIRAAMEADRLERLARGPVTQGSTAISLPGGANVTSAGDLGLNSGGCC
jgi:hypothetical protein